MSTHKQSPATGIIEGRADHKNLSMLPVAAKYVLPDRRIGTPIGDTLRGAGRTVLKPMVTPSVETHSPQPASEIVVPLPAHTE